MRLFLVLILLGLIGGAGIGWWPAEERESEEMAEALRLKAEAALGIRRMLRAHPDYDFQQVVVGRVLDGGQVDFRGQMQRQGRADAVYGLVSVQCVEDLAVAGCWNLTYLESSGKLMSFANAADVAQKPVTADDDPVAEAARVNHATARKPRSDPISTEFGNYVSHETIQLEEGFAPSATHLVARAVINTRSGPGTDNPVLTKLNAGARLALIEQRGGWGNFVILDGSAGGKEVWAALSLLEEAAR
ncbi:MAG: SH3 domain-containing protein [Pseudomonadota bacterium]